MTDIDKSRSLAFVAKMYLDCPLMKIPLAAIGSSLDWYYAFDWHLKWWRRPQFLAVLLEGLRTSEPAKTIKKNNVAKECWGVGGDQQISEFGGLGVTCMQYLAQVCLDVNHRMLWVSLAAACKGWCWQGGALENPPERGHHPSDNRQWRGIKQYENLWRSNILLWLMCDYVFKTTPAFNWKYLEASKSAQPQRH